MRGLIIDIVIIALLGGGAMFLFLTGRFGYSSLPCGGPCPGHEAISLESYQINKPTNMTLTVLNTGVVSTSFASYLVRYQSGQSYSSGNWSEPIFGPNTRLAVNIIIDGAGFTFHSGSSYSVTIVTARYNEYAFPITA